MKTIFLWLKECWLQMTVTGPGRGLHFRATSGASKSEMYDIGDIYEFPLLRCPGLVTPVNEEHLRENMQYWELRLHRMRFAEYPWTERKLYWLNEGGSHHFAAARYQACRLGISVPLTGRLSLLQIFSFMSAMA
ncbi:hypothetical protein QRX37_24085 (plasmid) [Escherichia coli]|uniref:DUF6685 family protein n=2 Tax=Escherichia coli TaxID=562 RepID=UPI003872B952